MNRRELIGATATFGAAMILPRAAVAASAQPVSPIFDRLLDRGLSASPQMATTYGVDNASRSALKHRLDDRGPGNRFNMYGPFLDLAPELIAVPTPTDPRGQQWLETARWFAGATRDMAALPHLTVSSVTYPHPYALTQLTGAYVDVPDLLATQHVIEERADCEAYLERLAAFPRAIDQDTAMSRAQATAGIVPPDFICERATSQLGDLVDDRGTGSGLVHALATRAVAAGIKGDWEGRATALVDGPVAAALARQRAHLIELKSRASAAAGIGNRPDGATFYDMALRFHLTTDTPAAEVHRIGREEVAATQREAGALMDRLGYPAGATVARLNALAKDPAQLFSDTDAGRDALLAYARELTEDVKRRLSAAFAHLPRTPMEVRRVPVGTQLGAPFAYSMAGSSDGKRPGAIYFNLSTMADWPRWQVPSTAYHEGLPGHHLQESLASETPAIPMILRMLMPVAYNEGLGSLCRGVGRRTRRV